MIQPVLPTRRERLKYYLGSIVGAGPGPHVLLPETHRRTARDLRASAVWPSGISRLGGYDRSSYDVPLLALLEECGLSQRSFLYAGNDRVGRDRGPVLVKNRRGTRQPVLLRCLNEQRHWPVDDPDDRIQFERKLDSVFWRGATTGWEYRPTSRMALVKRWHGRRPDVDVGFSSLSQEYGLPGVRELWTPYVAGHADREEFLRHKYIISAEGNDKDSGLGWKLKSNSLVFMVQPVTESWLMEPFLVPYVHYVPLDPDYGNLYEQLEWCRANPKACVAIVHNASRFMDQFRYRDRERELERNVLQAYFSRVRAPTRDELVCAEDRWPASISGPPSRASRKAVSQMIFWRTTPGLYGRRK